MDKYFIVFVINFGNPKGKELAKRYEITDMLKHIHGFPAKAGMKKYVEENAEAFKDYWLLKPIS